MAEEISDDAQLSPEDMETLKQLQERFDEMPENVRQHLLFPIPCFIVLGTPNGIQAILAIKAAKAAGLIRDKGQCEGLADNVEELGKILGGAIAGAIAGRTAKCACDTVF